MFNFHIYRDFIFAIKFYFEPIMVKEYALSYTDSFKCFKVCFMAKDMFYIGEYFIKTFEKCLFFKRTGP